MKLILLDKKTKIVMQILTYTEEWERLYWLNEFSYYEEYVSTSVEDVTYDHRLINDKLVLDRFLVETRTIKELEEKKHKDMLFFNKERGLALKIKEDLFLGLNEATESDFIEIREYLNCINPKTEIATLSLVPRPAIMNELFPLEEEF